MDESASVQVSASMLILICSRADTTRAGDLVQDGPADHRRKRAHHERVVQAPEQALRPRRHEVHRDRQHVSVRSPASCMCIDDGSNPYSCSPKAEVFVPLSAPRYVSLIRSVAARVADEGCSVVSSPRLFRASDVGLSRRGRWLKSAHPHVSLRFVYKAISHEITCPS